MTTFDEREHAFENMFAHDAEMLFRVQARRNSLLGRWAADKLGLSGDAARAYANAVIMEDLKEVGDRDVFKKVLSDLEDNGIEVSEKKLRRRMDELLLEAKTQIMSEADG